MKKSSISLLLALCFTFLVGCQTNYGNNLFSIAPTGDALSASVRAAFDNRPDLAGLPIKIETKDRTVFLNGYVKTIRQADTAGDVATKVPGVQSVQNELIVRK